MCKGTLGLPSETQPIAEGLTRRGLETYPPMEPMDVQSPKPRRDEVEFPCAQLMFFEYAQRNAAGSKGKVLVLKDIPSEEELSTEPKMQGRPAKVDQYKMEWKGKRTGRQV